MPTNFQLARLYRFLSSEQSNDLEFSLRGNVAVQRNIRALKDFFESLVDLEVKYKTPSEEYKEFENKRNDLIKEHAVKDDKGEPLAEKGGIRIQDAEAFNKALGVLVGEYTEVIEAQKSKANEWEEYLHSDSDIEIAMIEESDMKFDTLSKVNFETLSVMVKSTEESEG